MKKNKNLSKTKILFALILVSFCHPGFSASKKKNSKSKVEETTPVAQDEPAPAGGDLIKMPAQKRSFFYKINDSIVSDVETGSPESLKQAMTNIRKVGGEYSENEAVLISIATEIMQTAWPSQKITWDTVNASKDNPYMGAIDSVNQGVFDYSTGNTDFLSTLLPALVILKSTVNSSHYEACEEALKSALTIKPESVLANYLMARLLQKQEKYGDSEKYYAAAYKSSPKTEEIALAYASILRITGNLNSATTVLGQIEGKGNDISVLKENAYIAFAAKDYASAELYVAKVLQQNPNNLEFVLLRAKILIEKNDYIHAVSLLDMYARQDVISIEYLILRAKVQLDWSKNTTAATETVEKALQLYPDNQDALMLAARISSVTDSPVAGKYADELAAKVLAENPESEDALLYALDGLIQRENWLEAYTVSKKLINSDKVSSDVVIKYVTVCIELKKNNEAYEYAKKQLDLYPNDEALLQSYILAYSKVGSRDAVIKYIDGIMGNSSSKMKSYLYYRRSYLQLTEESQLADLRSSLISNPRNSDALFRLYEMYYAKADYRKAQYYLRQVVAINPNDSSVKQLNEALTKLMQ